MQSPVESILAANEALLQQGRAEAAAEFFAPSYVVHLTDRELGGVAFVQTFVRQLRASFPDLAVEIDILAREGDRVAWQRTFRGTHRNAYHGFPASGRTMQWRDMVVTRVEKGQIVEEWAISDLAEQLLAARK